MYRIIFQINIAINIQNKSDKPSISFDNSLIFLSLCRLVSRRYQQSVGRFRSLRLAPMHLLNCIVATIDGWPFRRKGGHARVRDSARILARMQIGHVTLWHSPNDCNTLRHCSQPLHACTHNISPVPPISSNASRSAEQCAQTNDELSENAFHASYSRTIACPTSFFTHILRILQFRICESSPFPYMWRLFSLVIKIAEYLNRN